MPPYDNEKDFIKPLQIGLDAFDEPSQGPLESAEARTMNRWDGGVAKRAALRGDRQRAARLPDVVSGHPEGYQSPSEKHTENILRGLVDEQEKQRARLDAMPAPGTSEPPITVEGTDLLVQDPFGNKTRLGLHELQDLVWAAEDIKAMRAERQGGPSTDRSLLAGDIVQPAQNYGSTDPCFGVVKQIDFMADWVFVDWNVDPACRYGGSTYYGMTLKELVAADMVDFIDAVQAIRGVDEKSILHREDLDDLREQLNEQAQLKLSMAEIDKRNVDLREKNKRLDREVRTNRQVMKQVEASFGDLLNKVEALEAAGKSEEAEVVVQREVLPVLASMSKRKLVFHLFKGGVKTVAKPVIQQLIKMAVQRGVNMDWLILLLGG